MTVTCSWRISLQRATLGIMHKIEISLAMPYHHLALFRFLPLGPLWSFIVLDSWGRLRICRSPQSLESVAPYLLFSLASTVDVFDFHSSAYRGCTSRRVRSNLYQLLLKCMSDLGQHLHSEWICISCVTFLSGVCSCPMLCMFVFDEFFISVWPEYYHFCSVVCVLPYLLSEQSTSRFIQQRVVTGRVLKMVSTLIQVDPAATSLPRAFLLFYCHWLSCIWAMCLQLVDPRFPQWIDEIERQLLGREMSKAGFEGFSIFFSVSMSLANLHMIATLSHVSFWTRDLAYRPHQCSRIHATVVLIHFASPTDLGMRADLEFGMKTRVSSTIWRHRVYSRLHTFASASCPPTFLKNLASGCEITFHMSTVRNNKRNALFLSSFLWGEITPLWASGSWVV